MLTPSEVLIAIHSIDPARDGIPLKQACLDHFSLQHCRTLMNKLGELRNLFNSSTRRLLIQSNTLFLTFLTGHRCMQYLFRTEADIHSTGFSRRSESTGTITVSILLTDPVCFSEIFILFAQLRVSGCRSSKFHCQCYLCVQFYKLSVLFQLW